MCVLLPWQTDVTLKSNLVVVPYLANRYVTDHSLATTGEGRRNVLTFFGSARGNRYREATFRALKDSPFANLGIARITKNITGDAVKTQLAVDYGWEMQSSRYCLQAPGDTITARRMFDAVTAGCIPVVLTGTGQAECAQQTAEFRRQQTMQNLPFSVRWAALSQIACLSSCVSQGGCDCLSLRLLCVPVSTCTA
jgi:hypothetical protein